METPTPSPRKRWFLPAAILAVVLVIGLYLADVLLLHTPPTRRIFQMVVLAFVVVNALYRRAHPERTRAGVLRAAFAEHIGDAFQNSNWRQTRLLLALQDYTRRRYPNALKRMKKLWSEARTKQERQVLLLFSGVCFSEIGYTMEAICCYETLLSQQPDHAVALNNLSLCYLDVGDLEQALDAAQRVAACPGHPLSNKCSLASIHLHRGELEQARQVLLPLVQQHPDTPNALALLSIICSLLEERQNSAQYRRQAIAAGMDAASLDKDIISHHQHYEKLLREKEKLAHWTEATGRPAIALHTAPASGKSILGGQINAPAPVCPDGAPMRLVAAIFCSELPPTPLFPKTGVLRFYLDPNALTLTEPQAVPADRFRVCYDACEDGLQTTPATEDAPFPFYPGVSVSMQLANEPMCAEDFRYAVTVDAWCKAHPDSPLQKADLQDSDFTHWLERYRHKLGGYAGFTDRDPRAAVEADARYDTLLLQLPCLHNPLAGSMTAQGSGLLSFFLPGEALKQLDFTDMLLYWDSF